MKKTYLVGGAVRDMLMGIEPKDKDYVVVGSTPQEMIDLGFTQVGQSFPVFLHPETGDEYALARKERKTGPGYHGFEFDVSSSVTLEEDLSRRDLTINSIAMDLETGNIIDPFNGLADIDNKVLRRTSDAFSEDPLRVLRVARFLARYEGFYVDYHTQKLCEQVIRGEDFAALSKERIWSEIERMMGEKYTSNGLDFLFRLDPSNKQLSTYQNVGTLDYALEQNLNATEKLYLLTEIRNISQDEALAEKIPSKVYKDVRLLRDFDDVLYAYIETGRVNPSNFVSVYEKYRESLKNNSFDLYSSYIEKLVGPFDQEDKDIKAAQKFIKIAKKAIGALSALNFSEIAKTTDPKKIKEVVASVKEQTVKKVIIEMEKS